MTHHDYLPLIEDFAGDADDIRDLIQTTPLHLRRRGAAHRLRRRPALRPRTPGTLLASLARERTSHAQSSSPVPGAITDYAKVCDAVRRSGFTITRVVSGMAAGVDSLAVRYAAEHGLPCDRYPGRLEAMGPQRRLPPQRPDGRARRRAHRRLGRQKPRHPAHDRACKIARPAHLCSESNWSSFMILTPLLPATLVLIAWWTLTDTERVSFIAAGGRAR